MTQAPDTSPELVYLDHAATSYPKPDVVLAAACDAMSRYAGNPGRGAYRLAVETGRAVHQARRTCATLLGVASSKDLAFVPSCTVGCNIMLHGLLQAGDRVVVGPTEHNSVMRPLYALQQQRGVELVIAASDDAGVVDVEDVERLVSAAPTRAVVCQHASNVSGAVQPIGDLVDVAHAGGALMLCDGAQGAGHIPVDLTALGVDAYAMAGHKGLLGIAGVGLLYLAPGVDPDPAFQGGTGSSSDSPAMPSERPDRYEAGTMNVSGVIGLGAAAELLLQQGDEIRAEERSMAARLHRGLLGIPGIRVLGPEPGEERIGVFSFVHEAVAPDQIAFRLDREYSVACRAGLHCSPSAHERFGTLDTGAVRMSVGYGVNAEQIDRAVEAVRRVVA